MCGIAGLANADGAPLEHPETARLMSSMLVHRGPDEEGYLHDGPVAFGFRRLSIIDLSTGTQPVPNEDRTAWVMLNGEIYNYLELRSVLEAKGHRFRTTSDTEVVVHAYESYGLDFVDRLRGMFAIAIWDKRQRRLVLARDRLGKKPLFYSRSGNQLAFASELKALLPWPGLDRTLDAHALHDYLTFLFVPSPRTIFAQVQKLPPAHMLVMDCAKRSLDIRRYWRLKPEPESGRSFAFCATRLRELLEESVAIRLRSDVPLGAFLSGGVDSSVVAGLMARAQPGSRTFNIGFPDPRFDETPYAGLSATRFGTDHISETVDADTLSTDEFLNLAWCLDEPFADSSAIPTYWVAKAARKHVTVALSGDGGDEVFGGYKRYRRYLHLLKLASLPGSLLRTGAGAAHSMRYLPGLPGGVSERLRQVKKALELSAAADEGRILGLLAYFDEVAKARLYQDGWMSAVNGWSSHQTVTEQLQQAAGHPDTLERFMRRDIETNMADDGLTKVDRASMACSLEVRCPLLDHRVVEFAMSIPAAYKIGRGGQKLVLKEALKDVLPPEISRRRKQGFEVPFAQWFQKDAWRTLLLDTLSPASIEQQGIFRASEVVRLRDELLRNPEATGAPISAYQLRHRVWLLFVFEVWSRQFLRWRPESQTRPAAALQQRAGQEG